MKALTKFKVGDEIIIIADKLKGRNIYLASAEVVNITNLVHFQIKMDGVWISGGGYKEDCFELKSLYYSPLYQALK